MTEREWALVALELDHTFRGDFGAKAEDDDSGKVQEAAYRDRFGGMDYATVRAALSLLVDEGQVWLPMPGELMKAVRRIEQRRTPPFAEALDRVLELARSTRPARPGYRGFVEAGVRASRSRDRESDADERFVAAVAAELGEGPARWAQARGRRELLGEDLGGEHGGAIRHRLEQEFAGFVEAAEEDRKVGLALERVRRAALESGDRPRSPQGVGDAVGRLELGPGAA